MSQENSGCLSTRLVNVEVLPVVYTNESVRCYIMEVKHGATGAWWSPQGQIMKYLIKKIGVTRG